MYSRKQILQNILCYLVPVIWEFGFNNFHLLEDKIIHFYYMLDSIVIFHVIIFSGTVKNKNIHQPFLQSVLTELFSPVTIKTTPLLTLGLYNRLCLKMFPYK